MNVNDNEETLFQKAQRLTTHFNVEKQNEIDKNYNSFARSLPSHIETAAKEGKYWVNIDPSRYGIRIWDAVPKLLKDKTFEGFDIKPKNPDEDDKFIAITWN